MTDASAAAAPEPLAIPNEAAPHEKPRYDRSIVEGPLQRAVWKIAWPTMLTNVIGGLQGMVDHVLVGNLVGFKANAAIGVSWQIFLVVIVFISSLFTGMSVLVARFAGARDEEKVNRTWKLECNYFGCSAFRACWSPWLLLTPAAYKAGEIREAPCISQSSRRSLCRWERVL